MPTNAHSKDELIRHFDLQPHPEGGYYRETYRAAQTIHRKENANEPRSASTAIYYMLCDGAYSRWHRLKSDELWHFYAGDPLLVRVLDRQGKLTTHRLGNALTHPDTVFQATVLGGDWFAAECEDPASFAVVGCTVAPGFEFSEFEVADVAQLQAQFPAHRDLIARLGPVEGGA
ncbi:cupin domain-containing protein [Paraburkholderia edwinii]|jgi:predicted cupin superfamily sugar epimerase|uniref:Cupin domain-containing protein n=1 Tax=Paraburkholderia edwinii TaxID=2861782 RepID=A0ABX8UKP1_9BURK|nr:cupin domain-containing protein [Paraburkholderia edwinii]QYD69573.1 cupin domain-containing protein [Paraburkholderia edwinii]